jgi:hypothetical protein
MMTINKTFFHAVFIALIASGLLNGCEKNQPSKGLPAQNSVKKYDKATTLHGVVSNNKGFVENGTLKVTSVGGELITTATLQNSKNYTVEIPANTALPLLLNFSAETGEKDAENFIAVIVHPSITKYDINPLTTAIAKKAMSLGGYTDNNMRQAAGDSSSMQSGGKSSSVDQTKATQHYGGWH